LGVVFFFPPLDLSGAVLLISPFSSVAPLFFPQLWFILFPTGPLPQYFDGHWVSGICIYMFPFRGIFPAWCHSWPGDLPLVFLPCMVMVPPTKPFCLMVFTFPLFFFCLFFLPVAVLLLLSRTTGPPPVPPPPHPFFRACFFVGPPLSDNTIFRCPSWHPRGLVFLESFVEFGFAYFSSPRRFAFPRTNWIVGSLIRLLARACQNFVF